MEVNQIFEALKFMVLGMTTVFLFLQVMVFVLKLQEKILTKYFPQKEKTVAAVPTVSAPKKSATDDAEVIAAITAAITEFKKN